MMKYLSTAIFASLGALWLGMEVMTASTFIPWIAISFTGIAAVTIIWYLQSQ